MERPVVWIEAGRIITRNADGGTSGWSDTDAIRLYRGLATILAGFGHIPHPINPAPAVPATQESP
jgi:hypothetical protein